MKTDYMTLYHFSINRTGHIAIPIAIAAADKETATTELMERLNRLNLSEYTISHSTEDLPASVAFTVRWEAQHDDEGDVLVYTGEKFKLLSLDGLRSIHIENTEEGKRVEMSKYIYASSYDFARSLASHRYPDRANEATVESYLATLSVWTTWLEQQTQEPQARAFNDRAHLGGVNKAWWKLITPQALVLLTWYDTTQEIHICPQDPEDEDYSYLFQLKRVAAENEITVNEFRQHLAEFVNYFRPAY